MTKTEDELYAEFRADVQQALTCGMMIVAGSIVLGLALCLLGAWLGWFE